MNQFLKFAVVGVANTLLDWLVFFLLTLLPFFAGNQPIAKAISFIAAAINSFFLNSNWTFKKEYQSGIGSEDRLRLAKNSVYFGRFFAVSLVGWVINTLSFTIVLNILPSSFSTRMSELIALICASGSALAWNFLANKFWTYNKVTIKKTNPEERKKSLLFNLIGIALLTIVAVISLMVMKNDSGTVDEIAHIPSGYSYLKYHDFRLNPEHPPLVKAVAAVPLVFSDILDFNQTGSWKDINQWESGWEFIYRVGNDADTMFYLARMPMVFLLLLLGFYLYRFAAELFGRKAAVIVLTMFTFYPDLLAHGHLVTTDVAAALGFVIAIYYFHRWRQNKTLANLILAGLALGIAQLLKFSSLLLLPILFIYILHASWANDGQGSSYLQKLWNNTKALFSIFIIALAVIFLVYLPMVWSTPAAVEHQLIETNLTSDARTLVFRNFLHAFEGNPFFRAIGHYILGIFLVFGRVGGGNATFILGNYSDKSISWFFPAAWLLKTPLSIIILSLTSFMYIVWESIKKSRFTWVNFMIIIPLIIYWGITLKGSLNIGIRHLIPTIPFVLLLIGYLAMRILGGNKLWQKTALLLMVSWLAISSLVAYPAYISYFNELAYGRDKHDLLVDSSLDWGQDLKRLGDYVKENNIKNLHIDYFGGGVPSYYIPDAITWRSGYGPVSGHIAVSATFYQFSKMYGPKEGKWSHDWLDDYKPVIIINNSILIFRITEEDLLQKPPFSPYPITKYDIPESADIFNF